MVIVTEAGSPNQGEESEVTKGREEKSIVIRCRRQVGRI